MIINKFCRKLSTLANIGYLIAPGTWGSLAGVPLAYILNKYFYQHNAIIIALMTVLSLIIISISCKNFRNSDPQEIILDEFIGCQFALIGLTQDFLTYFIAFLIFRFLDITKTLGIKYLERIGGATAILLDDIAAGIITNFIVKFIFNQF